MNWWKANKWKVIAPALAVVLLAAAFWYGGGAPGQQGWETPPPAQLEVPPEPPETPSETPETSEAMPEPAEEVPPEPAAVAEAPAQQAEAVPEAGTPAEPEPEPLPTAAPAPEPLPAQEHVPDAYQTDPVPEGKPLPVEPQEAETAETEFTCTISISCAALLDHLDWLDPEKTELAPEDGWILPPVEVTFYEGESVFNVLQRTCKQNKIHMEYTDTPMYNSAYIEGIHNLYEFDCGERSGWMYKVNEWFPNYGCSRYQLQDGDVICWVYTCELGDDVGGRNVLE